MAREVVSASEEETERFGETLATELCAGDVVYLAGGLGAGKTALARGLARGLGALPRQVASPTFAILHEYAGKGGAIVLRHLDLYRLEDREAELAVLGLPGAVEGAPIAVEWPGEAIRKVLPPTLEIALSPLPGGDRLIQCLTRASFKTQTPGRGRPPRW